MLLFVCTTKKEKKMRIVRVNMTDASIVEKEFVQSEWGYYGGRGLIDAMITVKELDPKCDPLGPDNILSIATGLFAGTMMTSAGRVSVSAKSPLTHTISESNAGGIMGKWLDEQQIKIISFFGQAPEGKLYYLHVDPNGKISLEDASFLSMKLNYETSALLRAKYGDDVAIASIGPAGERKGLVANVMMSEYKSGYMCRAAARGGMGAVLGSKGVKAIVVEKSNKPYRPTLPAETAEEFKEACKICAKAVVSNPMTGGLQRKYGSVYGATAVAQMGALPVNNFRGKKVDAGVYVADQWYNTLIERGGHGTIPCQPGCVCCCSNEVHDENGNYLTAGIEYDTVALMGPNQGIYDITYVTSADRFCDDYGIDTIDTGCALGVAMDEGVIQFGDAEGALKFLKRAADPDDPYGQVLINGCQAMGEYLHAKRIPTGKRRGLPAYDPRVLPSYGMTYERATDGADHTAASALLSRKDLCPEDQADISHANSAACDNFELCLFCWGSMLYNPDALNAVGRAAGDIVGIPGMDASLCQKIGREILYMEHKFNDDAGFTLADDKIADFFYTEPAENGQVYKSPFTKSYVELADERAAAAKEQ